MRLDLAEGSARNFGGWRAPLTNVQGDLARGEVQKLIFGWHLVESLYSRLPIRLWKYHDKSSILNPNSIILVVRKYYDWLIFLESGRWSVEQNSKINVSSCDQPSE